VLVYILEYLYTTPSLSYYGLKGGDGLRGHCLAELCEKHGFEFFLAELERGVDSTYGHENNNEGAWEEMYRRSIHNLEPEIHMITEVEDEWLNLNHVVDLEGTKLLYKVLLSELQIMQKDPFAGDPDGEDFSGPTGNSGVSATHYYHRSMSLNSDQMPVT
jgi:hypothetical protein